MAIMQIAEPGQSPDPHQRRLAAGIDLGTTYSLIATVKDGGVTVLTDDSGEQRLASVVNYSAPDSPVVGREAYALSTASPADTLASVKRFLGRSASEVKPVSERAGYQLQDDNAASAHFITKSGVVSPVQVSSDILKVLLARAKADLNDDISGVVITVPAYFDDAQRQATKDAANLAGMNVLRLINEPTAAALAYGLDQQAEDLVAVYDLGGGTFDISILRLQGGVFEVLSTGGDTALGGDDFDHAIADWAKQQCPEELTAAQYRALLVASRHAKEELTDAEQAKIVLPDGTETTLSREQFKSLIAPLIDRTLKACRSALRDAGVAVDEVDDVVLVGGSTRSPVVQEAVAALFNTRPLCSIDPDQVVAMGAAIQADILVGNRRGDDVLLLDVIPLSLGIETMGGLVEKIIPRNTTIPVARAQEFTTFKDGQKALAVHVVQGERERVSDCRSLARFELRGIPSMVAGAARIRVTYQVDADGLLSVSAREETTGVHAQITVKPSYGLDDEIITQMLKDSIDHAADDVALRKLAELRLEAEQLLENLSAALKADGDALLNDAERSEIDTAVARLQTQLNTDDTEALRAQIDTLASQTEDFAARRMDRSIKEALAGVNLDSIANQDEFSL